MRAVSGWYHELGRRFADRQHSRGGPIILGAGRERVRPREERYGKDGPRYLEWCEREARRAGWEVPQIMCLGASRRAIATLNGFDVGKKVPKLRKERPRQPALWTEHWPGWYDTWGSAHHRRSAEAIAFEAMRFIAEGGTGINFYMWFGGTNFGRDSMYLQTTSYDFDAPIDEYGNHHRQGPAPGRLCSFLHGHASFLLEGRRGPRRWMAKDRKGELFAVDLTHGDVRLEVLVNGTARTRKFARAACSWTCPPRSCSRGARGSALTRCLPQLDGAPHATAALDYFGCALTWRTVAEPVPGDPRDGRSFEPVVLPHNMLHVTRDETDYGWYRAEIQVPRATKTRLRLRVGDRASVWVTGSTKGPLPRASTSGGSARKASTRWSTFDSSQDTNVLLVLVSSLGMVKGDWMIGRSQSTEWKGLQGAWLDNAKVEAEWSFLPGIWGEGGIAEQGRGEAIAWQPLGPEAPRLAWYRATFHLSAEALADPAPFAFAPGKLIKGQLSVNGHAHRSLLAAPGRARHRPRRPMAPSLRHVRSARKADAGALPRTA